MPQRQVARPPPVVDHSVAHHLGRFQKSSQFSGLIPDLLNQNLQGCGLSNVTTWESLSETEYGASQTFSYMRTSGELMKDVNAWVLLLEILMQ